jgi:hypothetical protein
MSTSDESGRRAPAAQTFQPGMAGAPGFASAPAARGRGPVRWKRVVLGVAVDIVAMVVLVVGIIAAVAGSFVLRDAALADGRAPGTIEFEAGSSRYVIALGDPENGSFLDGLSRSERRDRYHVRESDQNEARCTVTHPDGSTSDIRGDRQASSTFAFNRYATVGEFTGKGGTTSVECRFDPAEDLLGTPTETAFMVHPANRLAQYLGVGLILGAVLLAGVGVLLILWGTVWRKPRG